MKCVRFRNKDCVSCKNLPANIRKLTMLFRYVLGLCSLAPNPFLISHKHMYIYTMYIIHCISSFINAWMYLIVRKSAFWFRIFETVCYFINHIHVHAITFQLLLLLFDIHFVAPQMLTLYNKGGFTTAGLFLFSNSFN